MCPPFLPTQQQQGVMSPFRVVWRLDDRVALSCCCRTQADRAATSAVVTERAYDRRRGAAVQLQHTWSTIRVQQPGGRPAAGDVSLAVVLVYLFAY